MVIIQVQGSRFKVQGSRFKVQGSRFKVQGSKSYAMLVWLDLSDVIRPYPRQNCF
jgi:hypothetical protein